MLLIKARQVLPVYFCTLVLSLAGCGSSERNDQSVFDPETGRHMKDWMPTAHMTAAKSDPAACTDCHGADYKGGIAGVSCTSCHLGGPSAVHPSDWKPVYSTHGAYVKTNNAGACSNQYCHGPSLAGVAKSGPSCTSCHLGGPTAIHPSDWTPVYSTHGPYAKTNTTGACSNQYCHGTSLSGVADSGPSCTLCHLGGPTSIHPADWTPVYSAHGPYVKANSTGACASQYCHGLSLTGVAGSGPSCTSCHLGGLTSGHPTDWTPIYSTHGPYVKANGTGACANQYCHGASLTGVADSGPSCTLCHIGGPTSIHPTDWTPAYSTHGPYAAANGTVSCANQYCHGASLTGVADSGPSCTSCHMGGPTEIHPSAWLGDTCSNHGVYAYTNGTSGCSNAACHGANLGGVSQSGPSCTQCHNPIPNSDQCNYCHGIPPDGTVYPNIAGKHAKHMQLNNVACAACHNRSCDQHNDGTVEVVFDAVYNAKTGIASFTTTSAGKTCSEISCHGGSQTPDWYSGTITVNQQCTACHSAGTDEYNGYYSGYHYEHLVIFNKTCTDCHSVDQLAAVHFTGLNSPTIAPGAATATIQSALGYDGTFCNTVSCHGSGGSYNWWQ